MKTAITARTFRRSDTGRIVHANQVIQGEADYIDELRRNRMVREVKALTGAPENKEHPTPAVIEPLSASPAAPASPQTTASVSDDGETETAPKRKRGRPRKDEASS